jgi:hypothetical protein
MVALDRHLFLLVWDIPRRPGRFAACVASAAGGERPGGGSSMRNTLALLAAGLIVVAGVGWYLGWYRVQTTPSSDGHQHISIDVNKKKIAEDVKHGVQEGTHKVEDFLKKEGISTTPGTPARVQVAPESPPPVGAQSRFRYNPDGSIEYTGEVSIPQPVTK